jgi:hypothetical protein
LALTFRTLGPWGAGKGGALTWGEGDNNIWELAQSIAGFVADTPVPVGIATITVSGTQMTIMLTDGTVLGPFTLPVLTFRWRGAWLPTTSYAVLDVITDSATGIYMVQIAHTSGTTFDPNLLIGGLPAFLQLFGIATMAMASIASVAAAGVDQVTAAELISQQNYISGANGTNGVRIGVVQVVPGNHIYVTNEHPTNQVFFYPIVGAKINNLPTNTGTILYPNTTTLFQIKDATQIRSVP